MNRSKKTSKILVFIILLITSTTVILPLYWMVRSSLLELHQIFIMPPIWIPKPPVFKNYVDALTAVPFARYFLNTLFIIVCSMVGLILTSTLSAFGFSRIKWKGREFCFKAILTSMMLPAAVTLIPVFITWKNMGLYGTYLPLIIPAYLGGGAFNIFLLRQFFLTIPLELDEAAYVDGASFLTIYSSIILPLSKPALIVVALFAFLNYWNDFFWPLIYVNKNIMYTIALGLQLFQGSYIAMWHLLMAASTVVIIPVLIVFIFGQKYFIEGIALTGLKG